MEKNKFQPTKNSHHGPDVFQGDFTATKTTEIQAVYTCKYM